MRHPIASADTSGRRGAAPDRRDDGAQPVVLDQAVAMAGIDQALDDLVAVELAAGDQLKQSESARS